MLESTRTALPALMARHERQAVRQATKSAVVGAGKVEATAFVTFSALQGADIIASRVTDMYGRHGDLGLHLAQPIVEAYRTQVRQIIEGMQ